jgi:hypothetical protein
VAVGRIERGDLVDQFFAVRHFRLALLFERSLQDIEDVGELLVEPLLVLAVNRAKMAPAQPQALHGQRHALPVGVLGRVQFGRLGLRFGNDRLGLGRVGVAFFGQVLEVGRGRRIGGGAGGVETLPQGFRRGAGQGVERLPAFAHAAHFLGQLAHRQRLAGELLDRLDQLLARDVAAPARPLGQPCQFAARVRQPFRLGRRQAVPWFP